MLLHKIFLQGENKRLMTLLWWYDFASVFISTVPWFTMGERDVAIFDHVLKTETSFLKSSSFIRCIHKHYVDMVTLICLFIVIQKRVMKYMTKIGQNTGILKASKQVQNIAITIALVAEYLKLHIRISS